MHYELDWRDPITLCLNFTLRVVGGGDYLDLGSQIVLPLVLRLDLSLMCFEMSYKNITKDIFLKGASVKIIN